MKKDTREEWLKDVDARQRNVVFPETAANEARFWRNAISGQNRLGLVQIMGITLMCITLGASIYAFFSTELRASSTDGTMWDRIGSVFGIRLIVLGVIGGFLLLAPLISRRTKQSRSPQHLLRKK